MTKLVIQIPCFNEEATLGVTLNDLPRQLEGVDVIEWLVVDDGSVDGTVEVARAHGVDHIVRLPRNQGLAGAFKAGLRASIAAGADIVVNTDADNQYCAGDIGKLIAPVLGGECDIVVGARPIESIRHFSLVKKILQRLGSRVVSLVSGRNIDDATSGFRAFNRDAALRLQVFDSYTYTIETLIQGGRQGLRIGCVPISTNGYLRPSRLIRNVPSYIARSVITMVRTFILYKPLQFFVTLGMIPFVLGCAVGARWVFLFLNVTPGSHIPSLVLAAILVLVGVHLFVVGLIAELTSTNRKLLEELLYMQRVKELQATMQATAESSGNKNDLNGSHELGAIRPEIDFSVPTNEPVSAEFFAGAQTNLVGGAQAVVAAQVNDVESQVAVLGVSGEIATAETKALESLYERTPL